MCIICEVQELMDQAEAAHNVTRQVINDLADAYEAHIDPNTVEAREGTEEILYATLLEGAETLASARRKHARIAATLEIKEGVETVEVDGNVRPHPVLH